MKVIRVCENGDGSFYAKGLCYSCYRKKWLLEGGAKIRKHGTLYAYDQGGCRCDKCRLANALKVQDYRRRKRAGLV